MNRKMRRRRMLMMTIMMAPMKMMRRRIRAFISSLLRASQQNIYIEWQNHKSSHEHQPRIRKLRHYSAAQYAFYLACSIILQYITQVSDSKAGDSYISQENNLKQNSWHNICNSPFGPVTCTVIQPQGCKLSEGKVG